MKFQLHGPPAPALLRARGSSRHERSAAGAPTQAYDGQPALVALLVCAVVATALEALRGWAPRARLLGPAAPARLHRHRPDGGLRGASV